MLNVELKITIAIDEAEWAAEYHLEPSEIRADVESHFYPGYGADALTLPLGVVTASETTITEAIQGEGA